MSLSFDASYYQTNRPDVYNAFVATAGSTGLTWAEFAQNHYDTFGRFEGSNPTASFDTSFYLSTYTDVAAAGVNPFNHFLEFGSLENRQPFSGFPNVGNGFDATAYANANSDLAAAGITSEAALYQHFVTYGQFESRPGAPTVTTPDANPGTTFTLTTTVAEEIVGTSGDDTINGILSTTAAEVTWNITDSINGADGTDTFNLNVLGGAVDDPAVFTLQNVEVVNIVSGGGGLLENDGGTGLDASAFTGATQVWMVNATNTATTTTAGAGQTIGFRGVIPTQTVTYADGATSAAIALDTAAISGVLAIAETTAGDLTSATVSGSVTGTGAITSIDVAAGTTALATVNLGLTTNSAIGTFTADAAVLTTLDLSSSTGNVTIDTSNVAYTSLATITGGTGNDTITVQSVAANDVATTLNGGAGNDILTVAATATADQVLTLTGGAGNDTFDFNTLANVTDQSAFADSLIVVSDFDASADVIDMAGAGGTRDVLTNTELANVAAAANLTAAVDVATNAIDAGGDWALFSYGGNSYIVLSAGGAADLTNGDGLIQITGVSDISVFNGTNLVD